MKIGIFTFHRSINYGAFLQAYALQKYVQKIMGPSAVVEVIDYTSKKANEFYMATFNGIEKWDLRKFYQYTQFLRCVNVLPKSKNKLFSDDLKEIQEFLQKERYDLIIAGSDEIWKIDGWRGFPTPYWLNLDLGDTIKVSYAASSRNEVDLLKENQKAYIKEALERFTYIGVRDRITEQLVNNLDISVQASLNCDPTFLYSFGYDKESFRKRFRQRYLISNDKKILGIMIPDEQLCRQIKKKYERTHVVVSVLDELSSADYNLLGLTPFEWVKTIGIFDLLVTNRFHGTVFAIKNSVPFLSVDNYGDMDKSKIYDLLIRCDLGKHYFPYQGVSTPQKRQEVLIKIDEILQCADCINFKKAVRTERQRVESFTEYLKGIGG